MRIAGLSESSNFWTQIALSSTIESTLLSVSVQSKLHGVYTHLRMCANTRGGILRVPAAKAAPFLLKKGVAAATGSL